MGSPLLKSLQHRFRKCQMHRQQSQRPAILFKALYVLSSLLVQGAVAACFVLSHHHPIIIRPHTTHNHHKNYNINNNQTWQNAQALSRLLNDALWRLETLATQHETLMDSHKALMERHEALLDLQSANNKGDQEPETHKEQLPPQKKDARALIARSSSMQRLTERHDARDNTPLRIKNREGPSVREGPTADQGPKMRRVRSSPSISRPRMLAPQNITRPRTPARSATIKERSQLDEPQSPLPPKATLRGASVGRDASVGRGSTRGESVGRRGEPGGKPPPVPAGQAAKGYRQRVALIG